MPFSVVVVIDDLLGVKRGFVLASTTIDTMVLELWRLAR